MKVNEIKNIFKIKLKKKKMVREREERERVYENICL
jgi:hypothetical protein